MVTSEEGFYLIHHIYIIIIIYIYFKGSLLKYRGLYKATNICHQFGGSLEHHVYLYMDCGNSHHGQKK